MIGLGMAGAVMAPVIADHPHMRLVGACDLQPLVRSRFEQERALPTFDSVEALLALDAVEAVYIATPQQFHALHALLALQHGKHVVVEKPMASTLAECDAMIAAAEQAGATLIVGHTHAFDPGVSAIRALIASGEVGEPVLLNMFNYTNFLYRPRRPEELDPARGGGVLWNQLPHQLDVARIVVDRPIRSVRAATAALDPSRPVDGLVNAFVEFEGGATAALIYSGYDRFDSDEWSDWIGSSGQQKEAAHGAALRALPRHPADELNTRRSAWSYGGEKMTPVPRKGLPHFGQMIVTCARADVRLTAHGLTVYDRNGVREVTIHNDDARPSHVAVFDELWNAVRRGVRSVHDGRFSRATVEAGLAIAESARVGAEVVLRATGREVRA